MMNFFRLFPVKITTWDKLQKKVLKADKILFGKITETGLLNCFSLDITEANHKMPK